MELHAPPLLPALCYPSICLSSRRSRLSACLSVSVSVLFLSVSPSVSLTVWLKMTCTQRRSNSFTSSPERLFCDHRASTLISDCITSRQAGNSFFFPPPRWSEKERRRRKRRGGGRRWNKPNGNPTSLKPKRRESDARY